MVVEVEVVEVLWWEQQVRARLGPSKKNRGEFQQGFFFFFLLSRDSRSGNTESESNCVFLLKGKKEGYAARWTKLIAREREREREGDQSGNVRCIYWDADRSERWR